ncbi:hypothetical protein SOASR032_07240 [Pragia fontium]|uniref:Uncharacterized protein n=1 Tax=Pragia fontium TaxID=82985 RepID=A0ABQ5LF47_9GAMM|nr:hypothetical protein [Pragia fontium]GKX62155.1 hypothetical protein SOASR032_07240 [Pragia fontium]
MMTIKNPVVSYGTAHDELKNGDLISGKSVQLSTDIDNAIHLGSDNGLFSKKPTSSIVGFGFQLTEREVEHTYLGNDFCSMNFKLFPHIKYTPEELRNKRFIVEGTVYTGFEYNQKPFNVKGSTYVQVSRGSGVETNHPLITDGDIDYPELFSNYECINNEDNKLEKLPEYIRVNSKYYAIANKYDFSCYPLVYPHVAALPGRQDYISADIRFTLSISRVEPVKIAHIVKYTLYEIL